MHDEQDNIPEDVSKDKEEILKALEEKRIAEEIERIKEIYGITIKPDMCLRVTSGRWVFIGRVVSLTHSMVVLEDVFGRRHSIMLFRASSISEMDCDDLKYIKEQVERRKQRKRAEAERR